MSAETSTPSLLSSIAAMLERSDAAGLVELQDHGDKKVRKAARAAIHRLRTRGVAIPEGPERSWSVGGLDALRGDLSPKGIVEGDEDSVLTRLVLSLPEAEEGAALLVGIVGPDGRVFDFAAYFQTDGQRQRMLRDWSRATGSREVPAEWVRGRLRWCRERTVALGHSVPPAFDEALVRLGEAPASVSADFLVPALEAVELDDAARAAAIARLPVERWPLLFDGEATIAALREASPKDAEAGAERVAELLGASAERREDLRGAVATAIEDVAIGRWLDGDAPGARALVDLVSALRASDEPERVPGVAALMWRLLAPFVSGPAHDHDHDHVHDENCDHDHD